MSPFWRVVLGLIVMAVGFFFVKKTSLVFGWFGSVRWAEEKIGYGSSRFFWKVIGVIIAFFGAAIATNVISNILGSVACLLTSCKK